MSVTGERVVVVDEQRVLAVGGRGLAAEQREERPGAEAIDDVEAVAEPVEGLLLDLANALAGQDVVELAEQQVFEARAQLGARIGQQALGGRVGDASSRWRTARARAGVRALDRGHRRVAPDGPRIQVVRAAGERRRRRLMASK